MTATIRAHNEGAAAVWGSGGSAYDKVSETIADVLDRVVARVAPEPGEKCLDVATGTGWTARLLKARGADVTGVDIGVGVIEAAKKLAPDIDFRVGDAEELDFPDSGFDVVTSTFGVMFVARPEDAARELARVCRKGGRLGLCTWLPGGTIEGLFQVMRPYMPPPSTARRRLLSLVQLSGDLRERQALALQLGDDGLKLLRALASLFLELGCKNLRTMTPSGHEQTGRKTGTSAHHA